MNRMWTHPPGFVMSKAVQALLCLLCVHILSISEGARIRNREQHCGYQSCPRVEEKKLNIHLVPHTHDDVGWLKTVDQYYYGSRSLIQKAGVQYIIDTVVQELLNDPERRFIYVETAFLWKWWQKQSEKVRRDVRMLIDEGRLEIISGGWSMNDEAVTHYHSIIDQFTWGFRRLNDTFGPCARPHVGWQIDPFGHSREQASLFAQMGFDGLFFGRLDYQDKHKRLDEKTAEFIWKGSQSLGQSAELFTNVLFNNYSPPPGFCFDMLCADEPLIDDPESPDNNIEEKIDSFLRFAREQARYYRTQNVILTMGGDFTYQDAQMWYKNLDSLIRYTNERNGTDVNIFYSTPSCYLKAVNDLQLTWPVKTDDFFPYASDPHAYWTGYFTSRPTLKFFERMGNNYLQVCKQLSVLAGLKSNDENLDHFREAMGIMQHHDAVTGTEKQKVAQDYARILYDNMHHGEHIASRALRKLIQKRTQRSMDSSVKFHSCLQLNISACSYTEDNQNFVVTLYNPLSRPLSTYVRLPIRGYSYTVKDFTETELVTQIVPIPESIVAIPGRESNATNELIFRAINVPPLGYQSYYISENTAFQVDETSQIETVSSISNELFNVTINNTGHVLTSWRNGNSMEFAQSFHYYEGSEGNNREFKNRSSGAYIFRPKNSNAKSLTSSQSHKIYKGPLVEEIHQTINKWVSQVIRLYIGEDHVEFNWLVGPIPVDDHVGKEIITRYSSDLETHGTFYTDSNGREMMKRMKNYRPTWNLQLEEPVAGNYYPVTSKISIKEKNNAHRLSVLTDRSQGGTSLNDGEIELMLHRRLLSDDAFGVGEALNEEAFGKGLVAIGQHYIVGGTEDDSIPMKEKNLAMQLLLRPWTLITPANDISFGQWAHNYKMASTGIAKNLPPNLHILTLEPWKENSILFRLEHIYEIGEDPLLSQPVEINIQDLFVPFKIVSVHETTLGGNQWLKDMDRLIWQAESNDIVRELGSQDRPERQEKDDETSSDAINVLLNPMQIRTLIIGIEPYQ